MSEMAMIERAARALEADLLRQGIVDILAEHRIDLRSAARAVLAAIREPSGAMHDAAEDKEAQDSRATAGHMWRAMIDAALTEASDQLSRIA